MLRYSSGQPLVAGLAGAALLALSHEPASALTLAAPSVKKSALAAPVGQAYWRRGWGWGWGWGSPGYWGPGYYGYYGAPYCGVYRAWVPGPWGWHWGWRRRC